MSFSTFGQNSFLPPINTYAALTFAEPGSHVHVAAQAKAAAARDCQTVGQLRNAEGHKDLHRKQS
jgi:hypothetical protein